MWDRTVYGRYLNHKWEINICGRQLSGRLYPLYGLLFFTLPRPKAEHGQMTLDWFFFLVCLLKSLRSRIMDYARKCSIFYTNLVSLRHPPTGSEVLGLGEFSLIFYITPAKWEVVYLFFRMAVICIISTRVSISHRSAGAVNQPPKFSHSESRDSRRGGHFPPKHKEPFTFHFLHSNEFVFGGPAEKSLN